MNPAQEQEILEVAPIRMDSLRRELLVEGRLVDLSVTEWSILRLLLVHQGEVLTRQQIIAEVRRKQQKVGERLVDAMIRNLRKKLDTAGRTIKTVRGVGYQIETANRWP